MNRSADLAVATTALPTGPDNDTDNPKRMVRNESMAEAPGGANRQ